MEYRLLHVYHSKKRATNQNAKVKKKIDENYHLKRENDKNIGGDENQLSSPIPVSITSSKDNNSPALLSASSDVRIHAKQNIHGENYSSSFSSSYSNHWDNGSHYRGGRGNLIKDPYRGTGVMKQIRGTTTFRNKFISPYYINDSFKAPSSSNIRHNTNSTNHRSNQFEHYPFPERYGSNNYKLYPLPSHATNRYVQPVVPQSYSSRTPTDLIRESPDAKAQRSIAEKLTAIESVTKLSPMRKKQKLDSNHDHKKDDHTVPKTPSSSNSIIWSNPHSPISTKNKNELIHSPASKSTSSFDLFTFGNDFFDTQFSWERRSFIDLENNISSPSLSSLASPISPQKLELSKTSLTKTLNQFHESMKQNIESLPEGEQGNMLRVITNWAKKISIDPMGNNFASNAV